MIVYGTSAANALYYKVWDGSVWGAQTTAISFTSAVSINWVQLRPDPNSNKLVVASLNNNTATGCLWVGMWDGVSSWSRQKAACMSPLWLLTVPAMSVAFQSQADQALVVYSQLSNPKVLYGTWTPTGWSAFDGNAGSPDGSGTVYPNTMVLEPNPNPSSNEIMLLVQDDSNHLNAKLWDGTTWAASFTEMTTTTSSGAMTFQPYVYLWNSAESFATFAPTTSPSPSMAPSVAPTPGGVAVITSGSNMLKNIFDGSSFEGASSDTGATFDGSTNDVWRWIRGASAPLGDEKIFIGISNNGDISALMCGGPANACSTTSWLSIPSSGSLATGVSPTYFPHSNVAYEQGSGNAIMVYGHNTSPRLRYRVWDGSTWGSSIGILDGYDITGNKKAIWIEMASKPAPSNEITMVVTDSLL